MRTCLRAALHPVLALALALVVAVATPSSAHAQAQQAVASPLTTKRLERLLAVYVAPTAEEAAALDRLHEAYLDKFRAELDPEIDSIGRGMRGAMPSQQEFEKFLRDLDRLQAKIAEADNAFFDSAANLLAEGRRPGLQRIREARERQRNLSGFTRMGPLMFGGGGTFVDFVDLVAREEFARKVPASSREQFDALLRAQEQRVLAQSRSYSEEIRKAFDSFYKIMLEFQQPGAEVAGNAAAADPAANGDGAEGADAAKPDARAAAMQAQMTRMQDMMRRMKELGKDANRVAALNSSANRAAVRQFAPVLPELSYQKLRGDLARRSMGAMGMFAGAFGGGGLDPNAGDLSALLARLRRDSDVSAETRAAFDPIELTWRRERADNLEKLAEITNGIDTAEMMTGGMGFDGGLNETMQAIQKLSKEGGEIDQRAYRAVAALIGAEKSESVFSKTTTASAGTDGEAVRNEALAPVLSEPEPEPDAFASSDDYPSDMGAAMLRSAPPAPNAAEIARALKPFGFPEASLPVLERVVADWTAAEWNAKVVPVGEQLDNLHVERVSRRDDGSGGIDPRDFGRPFDAETRARISATRRQLVAAIFAADSALLTDLGAALGFSADGAESMALRLERLRLAVDWDFGGGRSVASPAAILARADLPPEAARAFLEQSREAWKNFADGLPGEVNAVLERSERQQQALQVAQEKQEWESFQKTMAANSAAAAAFSRAYAALCDEAAAKMADRPELAAAIKRARLSATRPDVYKAADCATAQLEAALKLDGTSADQRARLEALKAEYDAVYEMLSAKIAGGDAEESSDSKESWRVMQERAEAEQKLLFQRNERTEKARSEARRILGDELAARVRGLVPSESDPAKSRRTNRFDFFGEDED